MRQKTLALVVGALILAGCANLKLQASASYMNDNMAAKVARQRAQQ